MEINKKIDQTKEEMENVENQQIDWHEMYLRSVADCDNIRKRYERLLKESSRQGMHEIIEKVISPLYNDIARGVMNGVDGCEILLKNFRSTLFSLDIYPIGDNIQGVSLFDDDTMVAVATEDTDDWIMENIVSALFEYGFVDKTTNKVITHAKVSVYKYKEA